jgi:hypothetical protein
MIRQAELWRVVGRRLTQRLIAAGSIQPIRVNGGIFFDATKLHRMLGRLERSKGWRLDGHVRNASPSEALKVRTRAMEQMLENLSLDDLLTK